MSRRRHVLKSPSLKQKRGFLKVSWQEKAQWEFMLQILLRTLEVSCLLTRLCISMKRRIFILLKLLLCSTNSVKDYINIAGPYGVTHIILFNKGKTAPRMRIGCFPQGPTLHFRVCRVIISITYRWKSIH